MTARIAGFVTREQAGLQRPRSVSRNITPNRGGCAPHHGGGPQRAAEPGAPHSLCISTWRAWQSFHMRRKVDGGQEWADIAYTGGYCQHGYAFAGRGSGVRTAAQGTNLGNQNFYALTWIGGATQIPTPEALDALDWWILELRQNGNAGLAVKPHSWFKNTGCPIQALRNHAALRDGKSDFYVGAERGEFVIDHNSPSADVRNLQLALNDFRVLVLGRAIDDPGQLKVDGAYGNETRARVRSIQQIWKYSEAEQDGIATQGFLLRLGIAIARSLS